MRLGTRIRFHILTGFLGSGKSTLLRRYLHETPFAPRVAVLINEFGTVPIDHTLVRAFSEHAELLAGRCACCDGDAALRGALLAILTQIESGQLAGVEDIVLETSGVADPSRILGTIAGEMHLAEYLRVASCVTVVEAGTTDQILDRFPEMGSQIASASRIVISKCDQHTREVADDTEALLRSLNPLAECHRSSSTFELGNLFADSQLPSSSVAALAAGHRNRFRTFSLGLCLGMSWPAFSVWLTALLHCHGDQILRFKGIIPLLGCDSQALVLQGVRHRVYEPEHLAITSAFEKVAFGLVFICAADLERSIRAALSRFETLALGSMKNGGDHPTGPLIPDSR